MHIDYSDFNMYPVDILLSDQSGKNFVIEIDGSSHYYSNKVLHPLGKTVLKYEIWHNCDYVDYLLIDLGNYTSIDDKQGGHREILNDKILEDFDK